MKRGHLIAVWLAIVALLIDGLLPTAVSAAALSDRAAPVALCGAAGGHSLPEHVPSPQPAHHCTLCTVCAGSAVGLLPSRGDGLVAGTKAGTALPVIARTTAVRIERAIYAAAQARAPPEPISWNKPSLT